MESDMSKDDILAEMETMFQGRDPVKELGMRIQALDAAALRKLVLISANKIGTVFKGGEYESKYEAVMHVNVGADLLLTAYDTAIMENAFENGTGGTA